jgi:hypothetical protein
MIGAWIFVLVTWSLHSTGAQVVGPFPTEAMCWSVHRTTIELLREQHWMRSFELTPCRRVQP